MSFMTFDSAGDVSMYEGIKPEVTNSSICFPMLHPCMYLLGFPSPKSISRQKDVVTGFMLLGEWKRLLSL